MSKMSQKAALECADCVSLRAELAAAKEAADFNLCCVAQIQAELNAKRARVAELESLLCDRPSKHDVWGIDGPRVYNEWASRVDAALEDGGSHAGADIRPSPERPEVTAAVETAKRLLADPSPGASERRTTYAAEVMCHDGGDVTNHGFDTQRQAEEWARDAAEVERSRLWRIVEVTEIRRVITDVVAAEKEGGSK